MMEEALTARLQAAGTVASDRITWIERPQASGLPALTLQLVSPNQGGAAGRYNHGGVNDLHYSRVQINAWAGSPLTAKILAREVKLILEEPSELEGVAFDDGLLDSEADETPETLEGGRKVYGVRLDFLLPWRAA